jgi:polyisoprenoid-binding protein YceI
MRFRNFLFFLLLSSNGFAIELSLTPDMSQSHLVVITRKAGLFGFMGHEHGISAQNWSATIQADSDSLIKSKVELVIPVKALLVDPPEIRQWAGLDPKGPGDSDRKKIYETMLGPALLDAEKFPNIEFNSQSIFQSEKGNYQLSGSLKIRGIQRAVTLPLQVDKREGRPSRVSGAFSFKQTDFGMKPVSIAGVIKVKDEVEIKFSIVLK